MWPEVLLLCLSGSLYPIALLAVIEYLGRAQPVRTAVAFLVGGAIACAVTGTLIVILVRAFGLTDLKRPTPSAAVDITLGAGVLVLSGLLWLRVRKRSRLEPQGDPTADKPAKAHEAGLGKAFVAGLIIYAPMLSYFASVKIIAGHENGAATIAVGVLICIVLSLLVTEVPIAVVALAPDRSEPVLHTMSRWVVRYTKPVLLICGAGAGCYLIGKGIAHL
jgi:hypothetical protein